MIQDANPMLEVVNKRQVHDIGHREQEEIKKIRQEILEYDQPTVGTRIGDAILAAQQEEMDIEKFQKELKKIDEEKDGKNDDLDQ